jgi:hypothetical protein
MCAYKARQSVYAQHNQCAELAGRTAIPMFLNLASRPLSTSSKLSIMVSCVNADGSAAACFNLRAELLASRSSISIRRYLSPSQLEMRAFAAQVPYLPPKFQKPGDILTQPLQHQPLYSSIPRNISARPSPLSLLARRRPESVHSSTEI